MNSRSLGGSSTLENLRETHMKAYKLALDNAKSWMNTARYTYDQGNFGQAYSLSVTARETIPAELRSRARRFLFILPEMSALWSDRNP